MAKITHSILLSSNIQTPQKEIFDKLCHTVTSENGEYVYALDCSHVDISHPIYLQVTAVWQSTGQQSKFLIPHTMVLLIWHLQKDEKSIGFLNP